MPRKRLKSLLGIFWPRTWSRALQREQQRTAAASGYRQLSSGQRVHRSSPAAAHGNTSAQHDLRDIYIGRQPIFDKHSEVQFYELLFRSTADAAHSRERMTADVLSHALIDIGLDKVAGNKKVFINASKSFLLGDLEPAFMLPVDKVGFEIPVDMLSNADVVAMAYKLKHAGFAIALDHVALDVHLEEHLNLADIVKVDLSRTGDLAALVRLLRRYPVKLLASKVENHKLFGLAKSYNFDYYQGYFYCKPDVLEGRRVPDSKLAILRAMRKVMVASDIREVSDIIRQDVGLSYRLLKYINSSAFGLRHEVASVEQALALLGLDNTRRWLSLLSMTAKSSNISKELMKTSLYRGRLLELLARKRGERTANDDFLLGMFSVLDALLGVPMQQALDSINLAEDIRAGLLNRDSALGRKLAMVCALESSDLEVIKRWLAENKDIGSSDLRHMQSEAMAWTDEQMQAVMPG